jgi:hypothetical protein
VGFRLEKAYDCGERRLLLAKMLRCFAAAVVKPVIRHRMAMPLSARWGDGAFLHRAEATLASPRWRTAPSPHRAPTVIATDLRWTVGAACARF